MYTTELSPRYDENIEFDEPINHSVLSPINLLPSIVHIKDSDTWDDKESNKEIIEIIEKEQKIQRK